MSKMKMESGDWVWVVKRTPTASPSFKIINGKLTTVNSKDQSPVLKYRAKKKQGKESSTPKAIKRVSWASTLTSILRNPPTVVAKETRIDAEAMHDDGCRLRDKRLDNKNWQTICYRRNRTSRGVRGATKSQKRSTAFNAFHSQRFNYRNKQLKLLTGHHNSSNKLKFVVCFRCREKGHMANQCRNDRVCLRCGG